MFVDETLETIEYPSCWRKERDIKDAECQTRELEVSDAIVQSKRHKDKNLQTEVDEQFGQIRIENDNPALLQFVKSWEPYIIKQLQKNLRSHAFDGYNLQWDDEIEDINLEYTLSHPEFPGDMQITGLSWNSTGAVIAAALGRHDHEDWCTHKSSVCTWNLDKRQIKTNKPDTSIEVSGCIMCISFHPTQPSILAAGTFNGEVIIWDTSKENDMVVASSGIGELSHREPVSKLQWLYNASVKGFKYSIMSIGGDGRVLHWRISSSKNSLKLLEGFVVLASNLPRNLKVRNDQEVGLSSISYSSHDDTIFILGSNSGAIFKCSTTSSSIVHTEDVSIELKNPVTLTYQPHRGPVHSVDLSPYHRHLFLSCGMDSSLRIYSLLQVEPVINMEPGDGYLHGAQWSPSRPLVLCVVSANGSLIIYDLLVNMSVPIAKKVVSSSPLYCIAVNKNQPQLIATGNGNGQINIFRISESLHCSDNREQKKLDELAGKALKN